MTEDLDQLLPAENTSRKTRFGITELMVVVAIFSVSLAFAFPGYSMPGQANPKSQFWKLLFGFSSLLIGVFGLSGFLLVVARCWRERRMPVEPGCFLILFCAVGFLLTNCYQTLFSLLLDDTSQANSALFVGGDTQASEKLKAYVIGSLYVSGGIQVVLAIICLIGFRCKDWWWRCSLAALVLTCVAQLGWVAISLAVVSGSNVFSTAALGYVGIATWLVPVFAFLIIAISCVVDLIGRVKRSKLHWFGVACFILYAFLPGLVSMIALRYLGIKEYYGLE